MKLKIKKIITMLIETSILICMCGCTSPLRNKEDVYNYDDVKDILIRFHVIANSDTEEDQNLKLKVRDEVIKYLYPYLKESTSLDESRNILNENKNEVNNIAKKVIAENGYSYSVNTTLSRENIPEKTYGRITLPQGNYEAFRVIIGDGEGHNWWCVMFPPLCFIDVTKGTVEEEETKKELDDEINKNKEECNDDTPKVKFKIAEIFDHMFQ